VSDSASAAARTLSRMSSDAAERRDRNSLHYREGQLARQKGVKREDNPLRYVKGKSSPDHPDIWEGQWDLGWDEAVIFEGKDTGLVSPDRVFVFSFPISYRYAHPHRDAWVEVSQTRSVLAASSEEAVRYLRKLYSHESVDQFRIGIESVSAITDTLIPLAPPGE
jgi:hypothetical protein